MHAIFGLIRHLCGRTAWLAIAALVVPITGCTKKAAATEEARPLGPFIGKRVRLTATPRPQRTSGDALPVVAFVETITKI